MNYKKIAISVVKGLYTVCPSISDYLKTDPDMIKKKILIEEPELSNTIQQVKSELIQMLMLFGKGGITEWEMAKRLKNMTNLSSGQANMLINTVLRCFSRAMFAESAKDMPADSRYYYDGPDDDLLRPECAEVMHNPKNVAEGFTLAEIADLPVDFVFGGGFNCRHSWASVASEEARE